MKSLKRDMGNKNESIIFKKRNHFKRLKHLKREKLKLEGTQNRMQNRYQEKTQ